jgi:hypothetical protein
MRPLTPGFRPPISTPHTSLSFPIFPAADPPAVPYYPNEGYLYGKYSLPYKLVPATTPATPYNTYYSLVLRLLLPRSLLFPATKPSTPYHPCYSLLPRILLKVFF